MHSKSDNIEIMIYDKADEVTKDLLESLLNRYRIELETSMRGSDFIFDCINLLCNKSLKINLKRVYSYIDSPSWIKSKKATINPHNHDDIRCNSHIKSWRKRKKTGKNIKSQAFSKQI